MGVFRYTARPSEKMNVGPFVTKPYVNVPSQCIQLKASRKKNEIVVKNTGKVECSTYLIEVQTYAY